MRRPVRVALALAAAAATAAAAVVVVPRLGAHDPVAPVDVERRDDGSVRSLAGADLQLSTTEPEAAADEFADRYGDLLGPGELVATTSTPRIDGGVALRFQQQVGGIPVFGGEASVQVGPGGDVLSSLADLSDDVGDATPDIQVDAEAASAEAVRTVAEQQGVDPSTLTAAAPEQWWYDPATIGAPSPFGARLTWRVEVTDGGPVRRLLLVDAQTGTVDLDLDLVAGATNRRVCDAQGIPNANHACTTPVRSEGGPATGIADVDRAYDVLGQWHTFFQEGFGWESAFPDTVTVRYCKTTEPCPYANAYWSTNQAVFGPGYAVDDVVAHEMTHGLTEQTAGLFFAYQSGAINESMSDVFGELIDLANGTEDTAANRWLIGEDLPAGPLRDLADPEAYDDPDRMTSDSYAGGPGDSGGAHTNSGVGNRAAALLVDGGSTNDHTVRAIGAADTAALWFTVLTGTLTSGSDYADLAVALRNDCRGLVGTGGITAADCTQVDEAVAAVEMDQVPPAAPATEAPVCATGQTPAELFADSFESGPYDRWVNETPAGWHWPYLPTPTGGPRYASDGDVNLWGPNTGQPHTNGANGNKTYGDSSIAMAEGQAVDLPVGVPAYLRFSHAHAFHTTDTATRDGGVVEIKVGAGAWQPLTTFTDNGYGGTISGTAGATNPLGGRAAFVADSPGYLSSRADLSAWAGQQDVRIRFRLTEDATGGDLGWYVDDVRLYSCPPTGPQLDVVQAFADDRVVAGQVLHLSVTVTNTGTEPLTALTVDTPEVPSCTGTVPDLDPGEHHTLECDHDTVAPDDVGTFTSTASADAAEVTGPIPAEPVDVTVLDPATAELTVTQASEQDTVLVGDDVDLGVTVRNTGAVPLTVVSIDSSVDGCDATIDELAVDAAETVGCTYTTVDPGDIGSLVPTATATATELVEPVDAPAIEVRVLAPDRQPPGITVTSPVNGAVYNQGQVVLADYSCSDDSGWVDCDGTVADGQPIETSVVGTQYFSVTATDLTGEPVDGGFRTYTVAARQPDGRIRAGTNGATAGDDRYNANGTGQNRTVRVAKGRTATFFVTVQNDGSHPEALRVRGQPGTTNYGVRYFTGGVDITALVRTGNYTTPTLAVDGVRTIKVVVTVGNRAPVGSRVDRLVTVTSTNDPSRQDVVRFIVRRR